jgi:hypothetical protein
LQLNGVNFTSEDFFMRFDTAWTHLRHLGCWKTLLTSGRY